jgi:tRNA pseudouridine55 synthase
VIDKPAGMTSHDVVDAVRRTLGERRVGHSGTLDPGATGVLLVGVGSATRLLRFTADLPKTYTCEIVFGVETDTLDDSGTVVARHTMVPVDVGEARRLVAEHLLGSIMQMPPMVSAVHVGGRRLHELARAGIEVEREPRPVDVYRFDVRHGSAPEVLAAEVECSTGTYVRVLAADLGRLLGGGAHLRALRRTGIGPHTVDEATALDALDLRDPLAVVRHLECVVVDEETAARVAHGALLADLPGAGPWAVVASSGELLAVYERHGETSKPAVVLAGVDGR